MICKFTNASIWILFVVTTVSADEFDRIDGAALAKVIAEGGPARRDRLSFAELGALPAVLRDARGSTLLIVATDSGNPARLLVAPALKASRPADGKPVPVLAIERFDTFDAADPATRLARGKDLVLYAGFRLDLDAGQIVPEGQGGDLQFVGEGPALVPIGPATLFAPATSPVPPAVGAARPSSGRVVPGDFSGRYRLSADGRFGGVLTLDAGPTGDLKGRYASDLNGSSYPVEGKIGDPSPELVRFTVAYPRARHDFEGRLWTEGKSAIAGTATLLGRPHGFVAVREGASLAPGGVEVAMDEIQRPGRVAIDVTAEGCMLDGQPLEPPALTEALRARVMADPETWVELRPDAATPYSAVARAIDAARSAGVAAVRLSPAADR